MNCDQAFDVLTRGPFPSDDVDVDDAVEHHLAACHTCRQLAEALRPAVGIFHETMAGTESLTLPGYRGELSPASEGPLLTLAAPSVESLRYSRTGLQRRPRKTAALIWPIVAAGLLGLVVGMFGENIRSRHAGEIAATFAAAGSHPVETHSVNREGWLLLSSMNLPAACRDTGSGSARDISGRYQCCTRCHAAADSATAPEVQLTTLTSSCLVCHSSAYREEVSFSFQRSRHATKRWRASLET